MKRAYRRRYHYIYKTTCKVTGKYYLGMHSTDDLNDGYQGSGKRLGYSIRKHGKENHTCEILEHYFTREWLREREAELVCAEKLTDPMCMNLKVGGDGGWDHILPDDRVKNGHMGGLIGGPMTWAKTASDPIKLNAHKQRCKQRFIVLHENGKIKYDTFSGKTHSDATKQKMINSKIGHGVGSTNSQFGKCWIFSTSEKRNLKVDKNELPDYISSGWYVGRKMKF